MRVGSSIPVVMKVLQFLDMRDCPGIPSGIFESVAKGGAWDVVEDGILRRKLTQANKPLLNGSASVPY